ncbi:HR_lesion domain-containing protein [Cephalotus follicularis]|uniref:HR_lesion domain-containing protein n=1 Tax=Cephalotus follicularis TaxID=3775 RepID=A0A1Q3CQK8_CEPFO|nr:HR_lesion domain-containing protein [Cephalotus follicularis]
MGFFSFLGRLLFASLFILSAWQMYSEFDVHGGPAAKQLLPNYTFAKELLASKFGMGVVDVKDVVAAIIFFKGFGGFLFVFGNSFGAYLLIFYLVLLATTTPFLYDFYNYNLNDPEFSIHLNDLLQIVALLGALLFFVGMRNTMLRRQRKKKAPKPKTN